MTERTCDKLVTRLEASASVASAGCVENEQQSGIGRDQGDWGGVSAEAIVGRRTSDILTVYVDAQEPVRTPV